MALTVGDLIRSSLRSLGVLASGEALDETEGADALEALRLMVGDMSNESLLIPTVSVVTAPLFANISEYTIGNYPEPLPAPLPENHIETSRPTEYLTAFIRDTYNTDYYLEKMDDNTFARISRKTNASRPSRYYVRKGWPLDTIIFESTPYADEALHLELIQPLHEFLSTANLTDVINLPPGYEKMLKYNLCIDLAPEWGTSIDSAIAVQATTTKKKIKRANFRMVVLGMDRAAATKRKGLGTYIIEQGP